VNAAIWIDDEGTVCELTIDWLMHGWASNDLTARWRASAPMALEWEWEDSRELAPNEVALLDWLIDVELTRWLARGS
jgi:hypothetical protein